MKKRLLNSRGTTLVELIVCIALLGIFCVCCTMLIQPCAETFYNIQQLSRAQLIADTIVEDLRGELMKAEGTIRFCNAAQGSTDAAQPFGIGTVTNESVTSGTALEFKLNNGAYYELLDAGYVPQTYKGLTEIVSADASLNSYGYLHRRYYTNMGDYYIYEESGKYVAYGYEDAYTEKFYMGDTVTLNFALQSFTVTDKYTVHSIRVDVSVYSAADSSTPLHTQSAIIELPNEPYLLYDNTKLPPKSEK